MDYTLHHGDCLEVMATMADNSVDAVVTDPPYGLAFMGKRWDYDVPSVDIWAECLRILKPGGHLLAFAGTRTQHRMAVRIEDAGFEIRDMIAWVYGSGFPKSHNLKGEWQGWGTALKPAWEPITMARKPLEGNVAANVLEYGTGALNVDGCRVEGAIGPTYQTGGNGKVGSGGVYEGGYRGEWSSADPHPESVRHHASGRWPANLIHDGSEEVVGLFPLTASHDTRDSGGLRDNAKKGDVDFKRGSEGSLPLGRADSGSAARFFYCAKASKRDRDEGLEGFELKDASKMSGGEETRPGRPTNHPMRANHHPTVKPTDLMRYLCRLVTPPGGIVLDPFMGSGSTGKAAILEGFQFIGIERDAEYLAIAEARISHASGLSQPPQRPTRQPAPACPGQLALF